MQICSKFKNLLISKAFFYIVVTSSKPIYERNTKYAAMAFHILTQF